MIRRSKFKTVLWSVYLVIMSCYAILGLVSLPQNPKEYIGVIASFIWCIGLFGFIFQRRILYKIFWRIWFSLILVSAAGAFTIFTFTTFTTFTKITLSHKDFLFYGAVFILFFPMYYALHAYAYRSPNIWQAI